MTAECYEYATAVGMAEHDGRKSLNVIEMMRIGADDCVKYTHYTKNESEAIPAERNGRAERSREKMNAQWMWEKDSCERLESLSSPPLSLCIFVCSDRNAHGGLWCENMDVSLRFRDEEGRIPK